MTMVVAVVAVVVAVVVAAAVLAHPVHLPEPRTLVMLSVTVAVVTR
jgi:hypothetical protein